MALAAALGLGLGLACRVPNEEHCANQEVPGNQFCRELHPSAPYCSPCTRELRGCVRYEPFACGGYDPDPGEDGDDDGEPASTGDAASTGGPVPGAESTGAALGAEIPEDLGDRSEG